MWFLSFNFENQPTKYFLIRLGSSKLDQFIEYFGSNQLTKCLPPALYLTEIARNAYLNYRLPFDIVIKKVSLASLSRNYHSFADIVM